MWGIFLGSLLFVLGIAMMLPPGFSPLGLLLAVIGMTLALMSTARYAVDLLSLPVPAKKTIYDDMGTEPASPE